MTILTCATEQVSRKRVFWATQPDACGSSEVCGAECGIPGLAYAQTTDCTAIGCSCCTPPDIDPNCLKYHTPAQAGRSIDTTDWVRSLVLNILMTDGRLPDTACGYAPGTQGGHWSESFREDGQKNGTLIRAIPTTGSIREATNLIKMNAQASLQKLVQLKIVRSLETTVTYLGSNRVLLEIIMVGFRGEQNRVGLSGSRTPNNWIWA